MEPTSQSEKSLAADTDHFHWERETLMRNELAFPLTGIISLVLLTFLPWNLAHSQAVDLDDNGTVEANSTNSLLSELFKKPPSIAGTITEINATSVELNPTEVPPGAAVPSAPTPVPEPASPSDDPALGEKPIPAGSEKPDPSPQPIGVQEVVEVEQPPSGELATESESKIQFAVNGGLRTYHSSNVTRVSGPKQPATAFEVSAGANAIFPEVKLNPPVLSFTPTVTVMAQRAYFGQYKLGNQDWGKKDARILDYEFRLASLAAEFSAENEWKVTLTAEYDELRNFHQGSKLYNAFVPSIGLSKVFPIRKDLAVLLDTRLRYALSHTALPYKVKGVFDDDGDNLQTSLNVSLMRSMGQEGKLMVMPSLGFGRTGYLKNEMTGRADYLLLAGISASYQLNNWLSIQSFANFSHKFSNEKGEEKLEAAASFDNWDIGVALTGNHLF